MSITLPIIVLKATNNKVLSLRLQDGLHISIYLFKQLTMIVILVNLYSCPAFAIQLLYLETLLIQSLILFFRHAEWKQSLFNELIASLAVYCYASLLLIKPSETSLRDRICEVIVFGCYGSTILFNTVYKGIEFIVKTKIFIRNAASEKYKEKEEVRKCSVADETFALHEDPQENHLTEVKPK